MQGSIQQHLVQSIRRAKQKLMQKSNTFTLTQSFQYEPTEKKHRVLSTNNYLQNQNSVIASAIKSLQQRINSLQQQKSIFQKKLQNFMHLQQYKTKIERQLVNLKNTLNQKQQTIKNKQFQNKQLLYVNEKMKQKISQLQQALCKCSAQNVLPRQTTQSQLSYHPNQNQISFFQQKINYKNQHQMEEEIFELKKRNKICHQNIQKLMKQLDIEKQRNMSWIKLYNQQLKTQQKQNILNYNNVFVYDKNSQKNIINYHQQYKQKIKYLSNKLKHLQDDFNKTHLIALKLLQYLNKHPGNNSTQIKNLQIKLLNISTVKNKDKTYQKTNQLKYSGQKYLRNSHSKSKQKSKKSLKLSDLHSSSKKSPYKNSPVKQNQYMENKRRNAQRQNKIIKKNIKNVIDKTYGQQNAKKIQEIVNLYGNNIQYRQTK